MTTLYIPADGTVSGFALNITGMPLISYYNSTISKDLLWNNATKRTNLTSDHHGIGLATVGGWWDQQLDYVFTTSQSISSPVINVSAYSRILVQGKFPEGTTYTVDILDPSSNVLQSTMKDGEMVGLDLWDGLEVPARDLQMRINVNTDGVHNAMVWKWGIGTNITWDLSNPASSYNLTITNRTIMLNSTGGTGPADLNNDGWPDLVFGSHYDGSTYSTNSKIFWGSSDGFSDSNTTDLPGLGTFAEAIGDLNADGFLDIVLANNFNGATWSVNSYIYWGSSTGYSTGNRMDLPTKGAAGAAIADLNGDGYMDLAMSNSNNGAGNTNYVSVVFWGSETGLDPVNNKCEFPTVGGIDVTPFDLNNDGYMDLVYSNHIGTTGYVYWGSSTGYSSASRTDLPTSQSWANTVADVNLDGWPDIIYGNYGPSNHLIPASIYWGSSTGFTSTNKFDLPAWGSMDASVADLNFDGWPDIVLSNHHNNTQYDINSFIYWGSASGYNTVNRTELPTVAAFGNSIVDFNNDGYLDIVFANQHNPSVQYSTTSPVYWGSASGYSASSVTFLTTHGPILISETTPSRRMPRGSIVTPAFPPMFGSYGNLHVNATVPQNASYWVNVTDETNHTLQSYLHDGDPINVDGALYPSIRLNLSLNTSNPSATPTIKDLGYTVWSIKVRTGSIEGGSIQIPEGSLKEANPQLSQTEAPGATVGIGLSPDNGTSWQLFDNNVTANFSSGGQEVRWRLNFTGDSRNTTYLSGMKISYSTMVYPSQVTINVGNDTTIEYKNTSVLNTTVSVQSLAQAIQSFVKANRAKAGPNGLVAVPIRIQSKTGGTVVLGGDADVLFPPLVIAHGPVKQDVPLDENITISFDVPMNPSAILFELMPSLTLKPVWSPEGTNVSLTHAPFRPDTNYNVTVKAGALAASGAEMVKAYSWDFRSVIPPKVLTFSPSGINVRMLGAQAIIEFNKAMDRTSVEKAVTIDPMAVLMPPVWKSDTTVAFGLVLPQSSTKYFVTISANATDVDGNHILEPQKYGFMSAPVTVLPGAPKVLSYTPEGKGVATTPIINVTFDKDMDAASVFDSIVLVPLPMGMPADSRTNTSTSFCFGATLLPGTTYYVVVNTTAEDPDGNNLATPFIWSFTTVALDTWELTLPFIIRMSPAQGAESVPRSSAVELIFSEAMDKDRVTESLQISPDIAGTASFADGFGSILRFEPPSGGFPEATYRFTLPASEVTDLAGNPLDGNRNGKTDGGADDFILEFTVGIPVAKRPHLTSQSPTGKDIDVSAQIQLWFDNPMNMTSVQEAFTIEPSVPGEWSMDGEGKVFTFMPMERFKEGKEYTINLNGSAKDEEGYSLGNWTVWSFTTKAPPSITDVTGMSKGGPMWWLPLLLVLIVVGAVIGVAVTRRKKKDAGKPEEKGDKVTNGAVVPVAVAPAHATTLSQPSSPPPQGAPMRPVPRNGVPAPLPAPPAPVTNGGNGTVHSGDVAAELEATKVLVASSGLSGPDLMTANGYLKLASHFSQKGNPDKAMEYVNKAYALATRK